MRWCVVDSQSERCWHNRRAQYVYQKFITKEFIRRQRRAEMSNWGIFTTIYCYPLGGNVASHGSGWKPQAIKIVSLETSKKIWHADIFQYFFSILISVNIHFIHLLPIILKIYFFYCPFYFNVHFHKSKYIVNCSQSSKSQKRQDVPFVQAEDHAKSSQLSFRQTTHKPVQVDARY